MNSILNSIKKLLGGMANSETFFDDELIIHINSVLGILTQLGVGPSAGYSITDDTSTWDDFLGDNSELIQCVKTYTYLRVRQIFDPPTSSAVEKAAKEVIAELEYRIILAIEILPNVEEE